MDEHTQETLNVRRNFITGTKKNVNFIITIRKFQTHSSSNKLNTAQSVMSVEIYQILLLFQPFLDWKHLTITSNHALVTLVDLKLKRLRYHGMKYH